MRRKAKFRVGQKVKVVGLQVRLVAKNGTVWRVASAGFEFYCYPSELRPLTKRERGERHGK